MITIQDEQKFDVIVIGSGIGGLTTAAILSKLNRKKVLVLEQHSTPGGFTHSFKRKNKYQWDVGLHYVGQMGKDCMERAIFDYITNGNLQWEKMPDPFEKFIYPDFTFDVYSNPERFQGDLIYRFPAELTAIRRYFRDIRRAAFWFSAHMLLEVFPGWLGSLLKPFVRSLGAIARSNTQHYLDKNFQDSHLKALLVSQWVDYGLPPSKSSFGIHSIIVTHYLQGGWYPVGGGEAIAKTIIPVIKESGGSVITQRSVTEILMKSGVAIGVMAQNTSCPNTDPENYYAPIIVSDAGVLNTYTKLLPKNYLVKSKKTIQDFPKGNTFLTVYLGLRQSAQKLGFQGENHWIYQTYNHDEVLKDMHPELAYLPKFCYLSFPSLKDPLAKGHTAEIIANINYENFKKWKNRPWKRRGTDYTELKTILAESLINLVESHYPGFKELVEYIELSTPLTIEHFGATDSGAVYGIPSLPERLDQPWIGAKTPIKNLYLTGSDTFSAGIVGAMMGGVKTAGILNGLFGFFRVMASIMK